jgi:hypothetical protein
MKSIINTLSLLFILVSHLCIAGDIPNPEGWRLPTRSETSDEWRNKDPNRYLHVSADLNGDAITDHARLLINEKPSFKLTLFIFLSQQDGSFKTYRFAEKDDASYLENIGIERVAPGRYRTACGKGLECAKSEPKEVTLKYGGISYFKIESAMMYLYWDTSTKTFEKAWMRD